jgi:hypothetical protein
VIGLIESREPSQMASHLASTFVDLLLLPVF